MAGEVWISCGERPVGYLSQLSTLLALASCAKDDAGKENQGKGKNSRLPPFLLTCVSGGDEHSGVN